MGSQEGVNKTSPTIICLTPVRNEAWILEMFLQCTSLWADIIIIADQGSTDGSREIALRYSKVRLIENKSDSYDEFARQQILIDEARKIEGRRLLITLDTDEIFISGFRETQEWRRILNGGIGEIFGFRWINICSDFKRYWSSVHFPWAMIDDGSGHRGSYIHSPRLPVRDPAKIIKLENIMVLHYQYTNPGRMESKHRYYQCLERINSPAKKAVEIYRMYHHMNGLRAREMRLLKDGWFRNYEDRKIKVREIPYEEKYWFDKEILGFFKSYGTEKFKKESIWDIDWNEISGKYNNLIAGRVIDPRNIPDRTCQTWLKLTQRYKDKSIIRKIDRFINLIW